MRRMALPFFLVLSLLSSCQSKDEVVKSVDAKSIELNVLEEDLAGQFKCSDEGSQYLELTIDEKEYVIHLPELVESEAIKGGLVCRKLLILWEKNALLDVRAKIILHRVKREKLAVPVYRMEYPAFTEFCREQGLCVRHVGDSLSISSEILQCQAPLSFSKILHRIRPRFLSIDYTPIPKVTLTHHPRETFPSRLKDVVNRASKNPTYASTMSLGLGTFSRFFRQFERTRKVVIFVMDAAVLLTDPGVERFRTLFSRDSKFYLFPMIGGSEYTQNYHWKMIFNEAEDEAAFSGLNLSTPQDISYTDYIYSFDDKTVGTELRNLLKQQLALQCERKEEVACVARFASESAEEAEQWQAIVEKACAMFEATASLESFKPKYFLEPSHADLEYLIEELIGKASKEILLFSHRFNNKSVLQALQRAHDRGVNVYVVTGKASGIEDPRFFYVFHRFRKAQYLPVPHAKLLMIDRDTLFFGSGNFTDSGLKHSNELFAITKDEGAIQHALQLSASYLHTIDKKLVESFQLPVAKEQWLALNINPISNFERQKRRKQFTRPFNEIQRKHFRKVTEAGTERLKACGLDKLLYLTEEDFDACIKS